MPAVYQLKDPSVCPPGSFIFKRKDGLKYGVPYLSGAVEECRKHYAIGEEDATQRVLEETYENIPQAAREYFIIKNTEALIFQNPTFRYVPNSLLAPTPHRYNASLITVADEDWLVYRAQEAGGHSTTWRMNFATHENVEIEIPKLYPEEQCEDPRVFWHNGFVHLCVCSWRKSWTYKPQLRLFRLNIKWEVEKEIELTFGGNGHGVIQKNWQFFSQQDKLHFIYWYDPFQVVCGTQVHTTKSLKWKYGEIRGGTPPILVGKSYYTFFHSRTDSGRARYHMGCLRFKSEAPFTPEGMTEHPLLSATNQEPQNHWTPLTVFPCGALYKDGKWCVSLGVNDTNCALVDYQMDELLGLLKPV